MKSAHIYTKDGVSTSDSVTRVTVRNDAEKTRVTFFTEWSDSSQSRFYQISKHLIDKLR